MKTHRDVWLAARELVAKEARWLSNLPHAAEFGEFQSEEFENVLWNHLVEIRGGCSHCMRDQANRCSEIIIWYDSLHEDDPLRKDFDSSIEVAIDELFDSWE